MWTRRNLLLKSTTATVVTLWIIHIGERGWYTIKDRATFIRGARSSATQLLQPKLVILWTFSALPQLFSPHSTAGGEEDPEKMWGGSRSTVDKAQSPLVDQHPALSQHNSCHSQSIFHILKTLKGFFFTSWESSSERLTQPSIDWDSNRCSAACFSLWTRFFNNLKSRCELNYLCNHHFHFCQLFCSISNNHFIKENILEELHKIW